MAKAGLTDEELDALESDDGLTDEDLDAIESSGESSSILNKVGQTALNVVTGGLPLAAEAGQFVDKFTGAPTRAAIGTLQKDWKNIGGAASAFGQQFGADPALAPTGAQLAEQTGLSGVPAKVAGVGIDALADPTNLIPVGTIAKGGERLIAKSLPGLSKFFKAGATKAAATLTGVPAKEIETYAKNVSKVDELIKKTGADVSAAADEVRAGYQAQISSAKNRFNKKIDETLKASSGDKGIEVTGIVEELEKAKAKLDPDYDASDIKDIQDMIDLIGKKTVDGKMSLVELNKTKNFLQKRATGGYRKDGQIYQPGDAAQKAAVQGAAKARIVLNKAAPEIASANNSHYALHRLERKMNRNLITPEKSESALLSAGAANNRNTKNLQKLSELTGYDFVNDADILAAQRRFADPEFLPVDFTGKSFTRLGLGGAMGGAVGSMFGATLPGAAVGAALTSPYALKKGIQYGSAIDRLASAGINKLGGTEFLGSLGGGIAEGAIRSRPLGGLNRFLRPEQE